MGAEALTLNGTGVANDGALRNLSGTNTFGGLITLGSAVRINSDAGSLALSHMGTITGSGFGMSVGGSGNVSISSFIGTAGGTVMKDGGGVLTLTAANTYSGATTIHQGTLTLSGANGSALNTAFTVAAGGVLALDNTSTNNTNRLSDTAALTLAGGELAFQGIIASLVIAHSFLAYFVGADRLVEMTQHNPGENWTIFVIMAFLPPYSCSISAGSGSSSAS